MGREGGRMYDKEAVGLPPTRKYFILGQEETVTTGNGLGRWTNENSVVSRSKVSRTGVATDAILRVLSFER